MEHSEQDVPVVVTVGDSPDARLFVELSSCASDLLEAHSALEMSIECDNSKSPLQKAGPYLVGFAVMAYCRCFVPSNVRRAITDSIEIPQEQLPLHKQVMSFRNATIAHSQSDLATTYPLAVLDPTTFEVLFVSGATVASTLPHSVVEEFRSLVEGLVQLLDDVIDPIRTRLEDGLRKVTPEELLAAAKPVATQAWAEEFNARTKRAPYPDAHPIYWDGELRER